MQVTPLDGSSGGRGYTGLAASLPGLVAGPLAIALDPTGQYLYVPAGATDAAGPNEIAVINLQPGGLGRVIPVSGAFRELAFAPDASVAFVTLLDDSGAVTGLARIDLATGRQTWLEARAFAGLTVAAP